MSRTMTVLLISLMHAAMYFTLQPLPLWFVSFHSFFVSNLNFCLVHHVSSFTKSQCPQAYNNPPKKQALSMPVCHDPSKPQFPSNPQEFFRDIRQLQHRTKCSTKTCLDVIQLFEKYLDGELPAGFTKCDKELKEAAGVAVIELNGCPDCHGHVYGPGDESTECPCCGKARYEADGKTAREVVTPW